MSVAVGSLALTAFIVLLSASRPVRGSVLFPVILLEEILFAAALGMLLSARQCRLARRVARGLPLLLFVLLYTVPVLYAVESVPAATRPIYDLNPLAFLVDAFRAALLGVSFRQT